MAEPLSTAIAVIAVPYVVEKVGTQAVELMVQKIRQSDIGQRAEQYFTDLAQKLAGVETYEGLEPGMLAQLTLATAKVDSEQLRNYWVQLAFNGMTGKVSDSEMRWAAIVLERLVPADAIALGLCVDRRLWLRVREPESTLLVNALNRLRTQGLVKLRSVGTGGGLIRQVLAMEDLMTSEYEFREEKRTGIFEQVVDFQAAERWVITDLGLTFVKTCDVRPPQTLGEFEGMLIRMDAAFFVR